MNGIVDTFRLNVIIYKNGQFVDTCDNVDIGDNISIEGIVIRKTSDVVHSLKRASIYISYDQGYEKELLEKDLEVNETNPHTFLYNISNISRDHSQYDLELYIDNRTTMEDHVCFAKYDSNANKWNKQIIALQ